MFRSFPIACMMAGSLLAVCLAPCIARGQVNTTPPPGTTNKTYAWTHRNANPSINRALALCVYSDASGSLKGNFCMYQPVYTGLTRFSRKKVTIKEGASSILTNRDFIEFRLDEVANGYEIKVEKDTSGNTYTIGWLRSIASGKAMQVRWKSNTVFLEGSLSAIANPCDEPPVDDIGEEELISIDASNTPSGTLSFVPGPRPIPDTSLIQP